MSYHNKIQSILGINVRARHTDENIGNFDPFKNPIIHKQINGQDIVPLNLEKLWSK